MFAKGPMPGYSPKDEALKLCPTAVCRKKHCFFNIVGYVIYDKEGGAAVSSARSAKGAWEKALAKFEANQPHVTRVKVMACSQPLCEGNEDGCMSSKCRGEPTWSTMFHDDFRERFGRCPSQCRKAPS